MSSMEFSSGFKLVNWDTYFSFLPQQLIQKHIANQDNHTLFLFLEGYNLEFNDGQAGAAYPLYLRGEKQLDPFCAYRLAEINLQPGGLQLPVQKERAWFYVLKSSILNMLKYNSDFFNAKEKIMTLMAKNGISIEACEDLILKYEHQDTSMLLRCCLMLVYGRQQDKANYYRMLLFEIKDKIVRKRLFWLFDFLLSLVGADLDIRGKDMVQLVQIFYQNTPSLNTFMELYAWQLDVMLMFPVEDNLILSKMRDQVKELVIVSKILKFGYHFKDQHILKIEENILRCLKKIYDNLGRLRILQDRVFFTFYYCEMVYKVGGDKEGAEHLLEELESMMMIKSQLGFIAFFYYLKHKMRPSPELLELCRDSYEKELVADQSASKIIVYYYLAKIAQKRGRSEDSFGYLLKGFELYNQHHASWSDLSLKLHHYFMKVRRALKRTDRITTPLLPWLPKHYPSVTTKQPQQLMEREEELQCFKDSPVDILSTLRDTPFQFYLARVQDKLCTLQKLGLLTGNQKEIIEFELEEKHQLVQQNILPIVGHIAESVQVDGTTYYNLYVVYPPCCRPEITEFHQAVEECLNLYKVYIQLGLKYGEGISPIRMKSTQGAPVLVGWVGLLEEPEKGHFESEIFGQFLKKYPLEFLQRETKKLNPERVRQLLEELSYMV